VELDSATCKDLTQVQQVQADMLCNLLRRWMAKLGIHQHTGVKVMYDKNMDDDDLFNVDSNRAQYRWYELRFGNKFLCGRKTLEMDVVHEVLHMALYPLTTLAWEVHGRNARADRMLNAAEEEVVTRLEFAIATLSGLAKMEEQ
jgi:hypothetical protein